MIKKTLKIGIAPYEEMKDRTLRIARDELRPGAGGAVGVIHLDREPRRGAPGPETGPFGRDRGGRAPVARGAGGAHRPAEVELLAHAQDAGALRPVNAHRINQGLMPELRPDSESDFYFAEWRDAEDGVTKVLRLVSEPIPRRFGLDPVRHVQVLCPLNRGGLGAAR